MPEQRLVTRRQILTIALVFEGGLAVLAWVLGLVFGVRPFQTLAFTGQAAVWGILGTLPLLAALWWAQRTQWAPVVRLRHVVEEMVVPLFRQSSIFDLAFIALLAGIGEEALFRGFLQGGLTPWLGATAAVILANLLFGALHPVSVTYVVAAAGIGFYLSGLLLVFDNLLVPILVHALYDFVALLFLVRLGDGPSAHEEREETEMDADPTSHN